MLTQDYLTKNNTNKTLPQHKVYHRQEKASNMHQSEGGKWLWTRQQINGEEEAGGWTLEKPGQSLAEAVTHTELWGSWEKRKNNLSDTFIYRKNKYCTAHITVKETRRSISSLTCPQ